MQSARQIIDRVKYSCFLHTLSYNNCTHPWLWSLCMLSARLLRLPCRAPISCICLRPKKKLLGTCVCVCFLLTLYTDRRVLFQFHVFPWEAKRGRYLHGKNCEFPLCIETSQFLPCKYFPLFALVYRKLTTYTQCTLTDVSCSNFLCLPEKQKGKNICTVKNCEFPMHNMYTDRRVLFQFLVFA